MRALYGYFNAGGSLGFSVSSKKYVQCIYCKEQAVRRSRKSRGCLYILKNNPEACVKKINKYLAIVGEKVQLTIEPFSNTLCQGIKVGNTKTPDFQKELVAIIFRAIQANQKAKPSLETLLKSVYLQNTDSKLIIKNLATFKEVANKTELKNCVVGEYRTNKKGFVDWVENGYLRNSIQNLKKALDEKKNKVIVSPQTKAKYAKRNQKL